MRMKSLAAAMSLVALLGSSCLTAPTFAADAKNSTKFSESTYKYLELFDNIFERIRKNYVEEVSDQELLENTINNMLTNLDPHSNYMTAKNFQDMQEQTKNNVS